MCIYKWENGKDLRGGRTEETGCQRGEGRALCEIRRRFGSVEIVERRCETEAGRARGTAAEGSSMVGSGRESGGGESGSN